MNDQLFNLLKIKLDVFKLQSIMLVYVMY